MAQPTPYSRQYNFTNFQAVSPSSPLPADYVDLELNSVKATLDATLNNLKIIQRDDTALANGSVGYDQLKAELNGFGFNPPSNWATATQYQARDTVFENNGFYRCLVSHVSGTFSTDVAAGDWELVADFASIQTAAAASAAAAATSATTATTQASTATTQASTATTKATAAAASATTATNEANAAHTDRLAADADVVSTHADAAQTASDRTASNASATSAANSATAAAASAASTTPVQDQINAAAETALSDSDELAARKASGGSLIKRTWANLRSQLTSYFLPLDGSVAMTGNLLINAGASVPPNNDCNQITMQGYYTLGSTTLHTPIASFGGTLLQLKRAPNNYQQLAFNQTPSSNQSMWVRSTVDGSTWTDWVVVLTSIGGTFAGNLAVSGEVQTTSQNSYRHVVGNYGAFWRSDGSSLYLMLTASGDQYGSYNALRPLQVNLATGAVNHGNGLNVTGDLNVLSGNLTEAGARVYSPNNPPAFSAITSKPTTLAGYGITDGAPAPTSSTLPVGWSGVMTVTNAVNSGATCAGSNVKPYAPSTSAIAQSGTWLNIQATNIGIGNAGLFVRTA